MEAETKTCCITGHRDIPAEKKEFVEEALRKEVAAAIEDGYTRFISGFAEGADLMFAAVVAEAKKENDGLFLEAAIPYAGRLKTKDKEFHRLLAACDGVKVISDHYVPSCYMNRNRYMVAQSQRVIAVYDGRDKGGDAVHAARCPCSRARDQAHRNLISGAKHKGRMGLLHPMRLLIQILSTVTVVILLVDRCQ